MNKSQNKNENENENENDINESINNNTNNMYKVVLKDIAARTGYTINTVSRALKDKDDISATTKILIQDTAKKMGYINNSIAGALRSGSTKTIAVILGDISNPHFAIVVKEIESSARNHKYNTIILNTDENPEIEEQAIYSALSKKVDGIIICPTQKNDANINFLQKAGVPFVLIGRYFPNIQTDYVVCDDPKGGYLATKHLVNCGHRKILFLNGPAYISSAIERLEGYKKALAESGIGFDKNLVKEITLVSGNCRHIVKRLLGQKVHFTAIFAFSDMIAWEAIYAIQRSGYRVPEDIAVVGFDNIQSKYLLPFPLTSIGVSKTNMSKEAFEVLLRRMNPSCSSEYIQTTVDTQLVLRKST